MLRNLSTSTLTRTLGGGLVGASLLVLPLLSPTPVTQSPQAAPPESSAVDVPSPEEHFGFEMGTSGRLADFPAVKDYLSLVAEESERVEYDIAGTTTMDNEYPVVFVSSADNLDRFDEIVAANQELATGALSDDEARQVAEESVPVVMVEATLHSTEVSSTQALMDVVHRFATEDSAYTDQVLDNVVMMIIPSANPDGQHLVVDYFKETAGTDYSRTYPDLYHRYVGHDNNRDWVTFSQPESQIRNTLEREYRPVMMHLMHQQGNSSERIFTPPYAQPLSDNIDTLNFQAANTTGMAMAQGLFGEGKTGVRTDAQRYGIFWNADVAGYSSFVGVSQVLTEIASATDLAYPQRSTNGAPLGPQDRDTGFLEPYQQRIWTLKQMVDYATSTVYTGVQEVAQDPQRWLYDNLHQVNRNNREAEGRPYAYVFPADQRDPYAAYELLSILDFGEVEIHRATSEFTTGDESYPKGSYVVRTAQPVGGWVNQLLEVDEYPQNSRRCEDCPLVLPYSETTDNLPMLFGVEVDPVAEEFDAALDLVEDIEPAAPQTPTAPEGGAYLVAPQSYAVLPFLADLQTAEMPVFRSGVELVADGQTFAPGTLVVPAGEEAHDVLADVSARTGVPVTAAEEVPQVPGFQLQDDTKIGLVRGINNMPGGWVEWMFTRWGVDFEVVEADDYADGRLGEQFDTIVLADGVTRSSIVDGLDTERYPERFHWARGVGEEGWNELRGFVEDGGNLVGIGRATSTTAQLLELPIEDVTSEELVAPGALLNVEYDSSKPAAWGMPDSWPTWFNRDTAYQLNGEADVASRYAAGEMLASGYADGAETLSGLPHVMTFDVGQGQATVASSQVTFRAWTRATLPLVTNSLYHGPSQAVQSPQFPGDAVTFADLTASIGGLAADGTITAGESRRLQRIVDRAERSATAGQTERAVRQLGRFNRRVRALVDDEAAADALVALSEQLIDQLEAVG